MINSTSTYTPSFGSRCIEIRDAEWICHVINSQYPHTSTTRHIPTYNKIISKIPDFDPVKRPLFEMKEILHALEFMRDQYKATLKRQISFKNIDSDHYTHIVESIKTLLNFAHERMIAEYTHGTNKITTILHTVINGKIGNCYEDARLSEFLLLLNGIKNACTAELQIRFKKNAINHNVCVFNRDGSKFNGVITKDTIVIDNWIGKVDFAKNMERFYRHQCKGYFNIPDDKVLDIWPIYKFDIPKDDLNKFREECPQLVFKSKTRKFMSKKQ